MNNYDIYFSQEVHKEETLKNTDLTREVGGTDEENNRNKNDSTSGMRNGFS